MNEITLASVTPRIKEFAVGAPEPEQLYWIVGNWEESADYCQDCAQLILAWLRDGGEKPDFQRYEVRPDVADISRGDNFICTDPGGYESEGAKWCEHCGERLDVRLLECGVESELDHFENAGLITPEDWRQFQDIVEGIEYVEAPWFPRDQMKLREKKEAENLYRRTLALFARSQNTTI